MFQLLARAANKAGRNETKRTSTSSTPEMSPPNRPASTESDAECIRRFLEALGQPAGSQPPPPVVPRTSIPFRPLAPVQPPPVPFSIPQGRLTSEDRRKKHVIPHETPLAAPPAFEVQERPVQIEPPSDVKSPTEAYDVGARPKTEVARTEKGIVAFLRSPAGLRNAIILREIFGPPRSLQPFDLVGRA